MKEKEYDRAKTVEYAKEWAYKRNPKYYNFDSVGGDCTSFVSQSIYAGSNIMNYNKYGWYYRNGYNKSASWSGVEFLHYFLTNNKSVGPYGKESNFSEVQRGDIIQLSFDGEKFSHTLVVVDVLIRNRYKNLFVATHTEDNYYKNLLSYTFEKIRFVKIEGVRDW